jgi:hypothetical protein
LLQLPLPSQVRQTPPQTFVAGWYEQVPELHPATQLASPPHRLTLSVLQWPLPSQARQFPLQ